MKKILYNDIIHVDIRMRQKLGLTLRDRDPLVYG